MTQQKLYLGPPNPEYNHINPLLPVICCIQIKEQFYKLHYHRYQSYLALIVLKNGVDHKPTNC